MCLSIGSFTNLNRYSSFLLLGFFLLVGFVSTNHDFFLAPHDEIKPHVILDIAASMKNKDVTKAIQKVAAAYDCKIVEDVLSHQLKQFVIDGNKVILSVSNPETRVDDAEFEENEVYAIVIVVSMGEGKPKLVDEKQTTIYKRAEDKSYSLKMKASRFIFSEISQKFPIMPFSARALEEKRARLGLVECMNHELYCSKRRITAYLKLAYGSLYRP